MMKETLHNGYLKIAPVEHNSFIASDKTSYEEIGIVLAKDPQIENINIGSKVKFDSFMAKKYNVEGKEGEFEWYVNFSEIVSDVTE